EIPDAAVQPEPASGCGCRGNKVVTEAEAPASGQHVHPDSNGCNRVFYGRSGYSWRYVSGSQIHSLGFSKRNIRGAIQRRIELEFLQLVFWRIQYIPASQIQLELVHSGKTGHIQHFHFSYRKIVANVGMDQHLRYIAGKSIAGSIKTHHVTLNSLLALLGRCIHWTGMIKIYADNQPAQRNTCTGDQFT